MGATETSVMEAKNPIKGLLPAHRIPRFFVRGPLKWSDEAEYGLRDTFFDCKQDIIDGVNSKRMALYRVNDDSWLVTEIIQDMLFIWCYQGQNLVPMVRCLRKVAFNNGLSTVAFFTRLPAAVRALRCFNPQAQPTKINGETLYKIGCAKAFED
jgi:hypothetical protein